MPGHIYMPNLKQLTGLLYQLGFEINHTFETHVLAAKNEPKIDLCVVARKTKGWKNPFGKEHYTNKVILKSDKHSINYKQSNYTIQDFIIYDDKYKSPYLDLNLEK